MTAVVGYVEDGKVWIGADSAGTNSALGQWNRADPKVFRRGEFLIGYTSSFRMGQILRYHLNTPTPYDWEQDMFGFMVARFVPAVRACFKEQGWLEVNDNVESGGTFLVGFRGRLYCVDSNFQVAVSADPFDAVGCGEELARGAMSAMSQLDRMDTALTPKDRVLIALRAAEHGSAGVRAPFLVEQL